MNKLEVKEKIKNKKYIEYKGVCLPIKHSRKQQYGQYDFFDMHPGALSGGSEIADIFQIGDFTEKIVSDTDNEAYNFKYWARDIDETHFEIVVTYYLSRGVEQERVIGEVSIDNTSTIQSTNESMKKDGKEKQEKWNCRSNPENVESVQQQSSFYCIQCGQKLPANAKFCFACGVKVSNR